MAKFSFTYAYDVTHYADFAMEAKTEEQALDLAKAAIERGELDNVYGEPQPGEKHEQRVFSNGVLTRSEDKSLPSMQVLINKHN